MNIGPVVLAVVQLLAVGAAIFFLLLLIAWLLDVLCGAWRSIRRQRNARTAAIEAELDAASDELRRTIVELAEAIAAEKVAAARVRWEMEHAVRKQK